MTHSDDEKMLDTLCRRAVRYFAERADRDTGLVADSTVPGSSCSIAAVGMGLTLWPIAAERGWADRAEAVDHCLRVLRFLASASDKMRHKGFFYHFLDMHTGRRVRRCELSTMDTALLLAGALTAGQYFDHETDAEAELRRLADTLYRDADWRWATAGGPAIRHGWKPKSGFLRYEWLGYSEALLLYVLALGSPTHPVEPVAYARWCEGYLWKKIYGREMVFSGPLFTHQFPQVWLDLRGLADAYLRERGIDYFENARRAVLTHRDYALRNPRGFPGYGRDCWGLSATDGPGKAVLEIAGRRQRFFGYAARGAPFGPDDGTITPTAAMASLPFAPEPALRAVRWMFRNTMDLVGPYGFREAFNCIYPHDGAGAWINRVDYAITRGPAAALVENHRTGLVWRMMRNCPYVHAGLRQAGFTGGWLEGDENVE